MRKSLGRIGYLLLLAVAVAVALGQRTAEAQCSNNTSAGYSTCFGSFALAADTTGSYNTAIGLFSLWSNTTGNWNTATGFEALLYNTTGSDNSAFGELSLGANTTGTENTGVGARALALTTAGSSNTAVGAAALRANTTGEGNTALGTYSLIDVNGSNNTAVGYDALVYNVSGSGNLALGAGAGMSYTGAESNNIVIGSSGVGLESNVTRLGSLQTQAFIAGIYGAVSSSGAPVYVNSSGKLGTVNSSLRFKEDVAEMGAGSDELMKLRPVVFHYKPLYDDGERVLQYGLIAEEVAAIDPGLVQYGDDGKPLTVRYHFVNAMLLSEVQKQHAVIEKQALALEKQAQEIAGQKAINADMARRLAKLEAAAARP